MKSIFPLLLGVLLLTSCRLTADKKYTVSGLLPDRTYDGQTAYILDLFNDSICLDSTIVQRGAFTFSGKVDGVNLARVQLGNREVFFVFENRSIKIDLMHGANIGTDLNRKLTNFKQHYMPIESILREVKMGVYNLADLSADSVKIIQSEWSEPQWRQRTKQFVEDLYYHNTNNELGMLALKALNKEYGEDRTYLGILALAAKDKMVHNDLVYQLSSHYRKHNSTDSKELYQNFEVMLEGGEMQEFAQFIPKGKYVLVNFWASWCPPCRREMADLKYIYKTFKSNRFEMLGVSVSDKQADAQKVVETEKIEWPQIFNSGKVATNLYTIESIPYLMLIGPDGTILAKNIPLDKLEETLKHYLI